MSIAPWAIRCSFIVASVASSSVVKSGEPVSGNEQQHEPPENEPWASVKMLYIVHIWVVLCSLESSVFLSSIKNRQVQVGDLIVYGRKTTYSIGYSRRWHKWSSISFVSLPAMQSMRLMSFVQDILCRGSVVWTT